MFLETVILVGLIVLAWYVFKLVQRVKSLERETGKIAKNASLETAEAIGQLKELFLPSSRDAGAPNPKTSVAIEASEGGNSRLSEQIPGLRRVLKFSIGVSLNYLREKTGITVEELKGLEEQFGRTKQSQPVWFWPASSMVMEEWATHTVVTDFSGRRNVIYPDNRSISDHRVIWSRSLSGTQRFVSGGSLQVVLFEESIILWAIDGRFEREPVDFAAKSEYRLVTVPLNETILRAFRSSETPPEDPMMRFREVSWIRYYECGGPDENLAWRLTLTDVVGFVAER
jgi:hypothetical protein